MPHSRSTTNLASTSKQPSSLTTTPKRAVRLSDSLLTDHPRVASSPDMRNKAARAAPYPPRKTVSWADSPTFIEPGEISNRIIRPDSIKTKTCKRSALRHRHKSFLQDDITSGSLLPSRQLAKLINVASAHDHLDIQSDSLPVVEPSRFQLLSAVGAGLSAPETFAQCKAGPASIPNTHPLMILALAASYRRDHSAVSCQVQPLHHSCTAQPEVPRSLPARPVLQSIDLNTHRPRLTIGSRLEI
ncbi:hypothetical protein C8F01DRAFT_1123143 [Mycena amicta]|nr:hypothetical protein C8F01DRAFT_1123143 [Mycena amicta]